jgi:mono/diheme cytochrome c family protein
MNPSALIAVLVIFSAAPAAFAQGKGNAAEGKDAFMKHCAACHGQDGNGNEALAKMMKTTIPPLSSKDVQALSDTQISKIITEGKGKMTPQKNLSSADVANLVAFIRSLARK